MKFIKGKDRNQTEILCLNEQIGQNNEVRLIDLFVESLLLSDFGFKVDYIENGRPAYNPKDLLKLYIYGYLNRMRSSRVLEKECYRNIEANAQLYRRRQAIVEHPYGIIKRQWGFYYIVTKRGIKRASADVGLMFTAFNLHRIFNILPEKLLKEYLKVLARYFLILMGYFKPFSGIFFSKTSYSSSKINLVLNARNWVYLLSLAKEN